MFAKAKQGLAHNTVAPSLLGNRDLKQLQSVINTEKDFVKSHTRTGSDFKDTADALKAWGESEGEDLSDVMGKMCTLYHQYEAGVERFNAHLSNFRLHFKSIRTREEGLSDLKARKRALAARIDSLEKKLAKMGPENKQLMQTTGQLKDSRNEMISMESEVRAEESALGDFKRRTARDALSLKCGGLQELAEKMLIIASSGRLLVEQVPTRVTPPGGPRAEYTGFSRTDQILADATQSLNNVSFRLGSTVATDQTGALAHPYQAPSLYDGDDTSSQAHPIYAQHSSNTDSPQVQVEPLPAATPINSAVTPIAARFASSSNPASTGPGGPGGGHNSSLSTDGFKDVAADEWGKAAGLALTGASGRVNTPPPGDAAGTQSYWRDADAEHDANIGVATKVQLAKASATPTGSISGVAPSTSGGNGIPDINSGSLDVPDSRLPRLQVVNVTPSPDEERPSRTQFSTGETKKQFSSNSNNADFDRSYFTEIGSTRALQESVRRPTSPPATGSPSTSYRYSLGGPSAGMGHAPASPQPSTAYEPPEGGRKMSAAAFKRGFARAPSAQSVGPVAGGSIPPGQGYYDEAGSPTAMTPTASAGGAGYGASKAGSDIEPLQIRKRFSVASGHALNANTRIQAEEGLDDAAPPYVAPQYQPAQQQQQHQEYLGAGGPGGPGSAHPNSVYGGVDGMDFAAASQQYGGGGSDQGYQHNTPWATPMSQQSSAEYASATGHPQQGRTPLPPGGW
ncbi:hypothetical protein CF327_g4397 [Tilletia walkeri]|nr:hypothetical protein CF327_g4397 [Tilletia walkeri]